MYDVNYFAHNWLIKRALNSALKPKLETLRGSVLDLGCGERPFEQNVQDSGCDYTGVDWSNSLHDTNADIIADLNKPLPFCTNSVNNIICIEVMEHLRQPELLLAESIRVLKPGGTVVISVPFQWWVHEAPWDYFRYTRYGLQHLLETAGFTNVSIAPTTGFWSMWILKLNYQSLRLVRGGFLTKMLVRGFLTPFWFLNQLLCAQLDKVWPEENETAGYVATAQKP